MTLKEKIIENINVIVSAYAIAFVIRLLLIEAYQIPSQSMVPSLLVKDILMVEKVSFGTYVPILAWKLPGFTTPKRNDVIVFISPEWKSPGFAKELISILSLSLINLDNTFDTPKNLVKRLVAIPGDRLSMSNRVLRLNNIDMKTDYISTSRQIVYDRMMKMGYMDFDLYQENDGNKNRIVQRLYGDINLKKDEVYKFDEIYVPKKGDVICLTNINNFYKNLISYLIERESGKVLTISNGNIYLEGEQIVQWKTRYNYYFAMGDNRDWSQDCRYFGFIPENKIFGKPLFRYFPFTRLGFNVNEKEKSVRNKNFY